MDSSWCMRFRSCMNGDSRPKNTTLPVSLTGNVSEPVAFAYRGESQREREIGFIGFRLGSKNRQAIGDELIDQEAGRYHHLADKVTGRYASAEVKGKRWRAPVLRASAQARGHCP